MINKPNPVIKVDYTPNPVYGPMGRKVTPLGRDSWKMQHREAMVPDRTINVKNRPTEYLDNEPIEPVHLDLTPIRTMDDLKQ